MSVTEYEPVAIGPKYSSHPKTLTRQQADALMRYGEIRGIRLLEYVSSRQVRPQSYVGVVALDGLVLEILPKIEGTCDEPEVRHNLLMMIGVSFGLDIRESEVTRLGTQPRTLLDFLVTLYCRRLLLLARQGLVKSYNEVEDDLSVMRGKLVATQQFTRNAVHPERLACRFWEFSEDNLLNRTLKGALLKVRPLIHDFEAQRLATELLFLLDDVDDSVDVRAAERLVLDRTNERYKPIFELAKLILRQLSPDVTSGSIVSFALLFDMNELFEQYIGIMIARTMRGTELHARLQARGYHLARDTADRSRKFPLIPDIVVTQRDKAVGVIDTKWKRLTLAKARLGVQPGDMYQMVAYARGLACKRIVLLYPHNVGVGNEPGPLIRYQLEPEAGVDVCIESISLAKLASVPEQCRSLVSRLTGVSSSYQPASLDAALC
ncbi:MAG: hypothetical protein U1F48_00230 [Burkholderiales bacterium]